MAHSLRRRVLLSPEELEVAFAVEEAAEPEAPKEARKEAAAPGAHGVAIAPVGRGAYMVVYRRVSEGNEARPVLLPFVVPG